jgi:hypothetical protein
LVRTFAREISRTRGKPSFQRATVVSALFLGKRLINEMELNNIKVYNKTINRICQKEKILIEILQPMYAIVSALLTILKPSQLP